MKRIHIKSVFFLRDIKMSETQFLQSYFSLNFCYFLYAMVLLVAAHLKKKNIFNNTP